MPSIAQLKYWESLRGYKGEKAPHWKGNKIGKVGVHQWLNAKYGKPKFCEGCGTEEIRTYDWANISGKYIRDREDFLRLCRTCHRRFDMTPEKKAQAIKNLVWVTRKRRDGYNEKYLD